MSCSRNFSSPYPSSSQKSRIGCLHCSFQADDVSDLMSHERACYSSQNQSAIFSKPVNKKAGKQEQVKVNMLQTMYDEDLGEVHFHVVKMEESDELENGSSSQNSDLNSMITDLLKQEGVPLKCICGRHQYGFRMKCYHCEDWFHGLCVGITAATRKQLELEGSEWFCPRCNLKESPLVHKAKLIQALNSLNKVFPPVAKSADLLEESINQSSQSPRDSTPPPDLEHDNYDLSHLEENPMSPKTEPPSLSFLGPSAPLSTEEEEEALCRAELDRLAQEIKVAQAVLLNTKKSWEEEVGMVRIVKAEEMEEPSAIAVQINALKEEQRARIATFSLLEMKLFQISCGHVFDDIRRKEEEWMKSVDDSDVE